MSPRKAQQLSLFAPDNALLRCNCAFARQWMLQKSRVVLLQYMSTIVVDAHYYPGSRQPCCLAPLVSEHWAIWAHKAEGLGEACGGGHGFHGSEQGIPW